MITDEMRRKTNGWGRGERRRVEERRGGERRG